MVLPYILLLTEINIYVSDFVVCTHKRQYGQHSRLHIRSKPTSRITEYTIIYTSVYITYVIFILCTELNLVTYVPWTHIVPLFTNWEPIRIFAN
jgi:hypothetical protein